MQITFDTVSVIQPPPVTPAPQPQQRPRVAPAGGRERSQNNADKGTDFKTALDNALNGQSSTVTARAEERPNLSPRPQKYPTAPASDVDGAESNELFTMTQKGAEMASRPEFLSAASEYAARFFSVASAYAKPGENLELTA